MPFCTVFLLCLTGATWRWWRFVGLDYAPSCVAWQGPDDQAKNSLIACVSSENAQRAVTLPSRTCMISAVR